MTIKLTYIVLLAVTFSTVYSQKSSNEKKGDKQFERYAYIDAIKTFERLYDKGYKSADVLLKIGNAYYFNAELEKANKWYSKLFVTKGKQDPEFYYRYSQTLKSINDYEKADKMMAIFSQKSSTDSRAKMFDGKKDYLEIIKRSSGRFILENAGINSKYSDYGSAFMGSKVVFCSARDTGNFSKRIHTWTGQNFTNLYSANLAENGDLSGVDKFGKAINTKFHEDTPVFTKDGKTVYFTRNNYLKSKGYDSNKVMLLKIYKATLDDDGTWINITQLPFNSDLYSVAHPALSTDERILYFASDMPGTLGQSDLFKAVINDNGTFSTPQNLGTAINTAGRETFPFISEENELYFASDGQPGLGGLDIFAVRLLQKTSVFAEPVNIGEPANSPKDDFAFIINTNTKKGFLSSNRDGGQGNDDIYKFTEIKPIWCDQNLFGVVTDADTKEVLPNTKLILFDNKFTKIKETVSDAVGNYQFVDVDCGAKYYVNASKKDYETKEASVVMGLETGKTELNIDLKVRVSTVKVGDDIGKSLKINIIYFDLDKWNIRPDAAIELAKVQDVLEQNLSMKINIRSHTDSRAPFDYNKKLSELRAKSTKDWLVKHGIATNRLTAEGVGENELVNKCSDEVDCTDAEHQANRRSEFVIINL